MNIHEFTKFLADKRSYALVLRGIHGAGKTALVKLIQDTYPGTVRVVSVDSFFTSEGKYNYVPGKIQEANHACFNNFMDALDDEVDLIIVDNTSIHAHEAAPYILAASSSGYMAGLANLRATDPFACLSRTKKRIQDSKILEMHRAMEAETLPAWWYVFELDPASWEKRGSSATPPVRKKVTAGDAESTTTQAPTHH